MMEQKKLVPKRRFEGFDAEWKECELRDAAESFEYGLNASAINFDGENKYIRITDIDENTRLFNQNELTSPKTDLAIAANYLLRKGDVLFARTGASVGKTYRYQNYDGKVYFAGFLIRARIKYGFDSEFIFQQTLTRKYHSYIKITSQRSGQPGVNAQEYADYKLIVPSIKEQQKIGQFFKHLDEMITLEQRKIDKTKALKSAYLAEMFPAEGERVPKRRFAGFTDEWKKQMLGDLVIIATGKLDANAMEANGKYDFYTSGINKYKINTYAFSGPSITIAGNGANVGYMHLADGYFNAYQRTYVLNNISSDRMFLYYSIKKHLPEKINEEARMGNIPYIVMDMLTDLKVNLPVDIEEQIKVGRFFQKLEDKINNHCIKLEKL